MTTPIRADIEVVGVGVIEADPFHRFHLAGPDWPDDTHHASLRRRAMSIWNIERAPRGWVVWSASAPYEPVPIPIDDVVRVDSLGFKLRPREADGVGRASVPAAEIASTPSVRMKLRGLSFIDTAWPLSLAAPRRLAVYDGQLVDVIATAAQVSERPADALVDFVLHEQVRWSAVPARFDVPLRWLVDAGVPTPVPPTQIDAWDVALDGSLHEARLGSFGTLSRREGHVQHSKRGLFPGVVAGLVPERVKEWRELEEQVAMWPRDEGPPSVP